MLGPKNTSVGLAGQKAWHVCAGEAAPRVSGKYLPSRRRWLRIIVENVGEKRGLVLLLLAAAEKEIDQALGRTHLGRQRHGTNDGGCNKRAAELTLKGRFGTQSLLHPTRRTPLAAGGCALQNSRSPKSWRVTPL